MECLASRWNRFWVALSREIDKPTHFSLSTPKKIDALLELMGMQACNPCRQTGQTKHVLRSRDVTGDAACADPQKYRRTVGMLLWVARMYRCDIMQRTAELARFMHDPSEGHFQALQYLTRYVQGTRDVKLVFKHDQDVPDDQLPFVGFMDEAYRNHKSTTGYYFTMNNVAFSWRSRKQEVIADSSTAAELIAGAETSKQTVWLRRLFSDLSYTQLGPTTLFEDNDACSKLIQTYSGHDRI